ncbi:MAG TPA: hypothetical protein VFE98_06715 [Candidatus Bathyarchaeia archaeon]|nr:hypothetical protein [Candidatus Bathyarchaeia archaeon]
MIILRLFKRELIDLALKVDNYRVTARFGRLFPDPAVFEAPEHMVRNYLIAAGLSKDKALLIHQSNDDPEPIDDLGKPAMASGTSRFRFAGRTILAEYMANASLQLDYVDFGTGLTAADHSNLWKKQKWGESSFELRNFLHSSQTVNIPDVSELYRILKNQATPTALSTIELPGVSENMFTAVSSYMDGQLGEHAAKDGLEVEVYSARTLTASEKAALEKRLTRESTKNTIYVILSKPAMQQSAEQSG